MLYCGDYSITILEGKLFYRDHITKTEIEIALSSNPDNYLKGITDSITVYDSNDKILYHYPEQIYDNLTVQKNITEKNKMCTDKYCCLELTDNIGYYASKTGNKVELVQNETAITLNEYSQFSFIDSKKVISYHGPKDTYVAKCNPDNDSITVYNGKC